MSAVADFRRYLAECPLIAILRGLTEERAVEIGEALVDAGVRIIEVPLNSPNPLAAIKILSAALGDKALIGAGTVLDSAHVAQVAQAGGRLIVSPNSNNAVIGQTLATGLASVPGIFTPTEAFAALAAGAHALKLFPAEAAGPSAVKALRTVLPSEAPLVIVGGITPELLPRYQEAGASGFGLGSGLYRPGDGAAEVHQRSRAYVKCLKGFSASL